MITGSVNPDREAVIRIRLGGSEGQEVEINAIVDTGFNGYLTLPLDLIQNLGFIRIGRGRSLLANDTEDIYDIYAATVLWDGYYREVEADSAVKTSLVGMAMLYGHDLRIQVMDGGAVEITWP